MCEGSCGVESRMFHFTGVGVWVPHGSLWGELLGAVVTRLCKSSLGPRAAVDTTGVSCISYVDTLHRVYLQIMLFI